MRFKYSTLVCFTTRYVGTPCCVLALTSLAQAADKTWTGGTDLLWDTTTANWSASNWVDYDTAHFTATGAGSTISISGTQRANYLSFEADNFTIQGGTLVLGSPSGGPSITVGTGLTATLNTTLGAAGGGGNWNKNGLGTLIFGSTDTTNRTVNLNAGTLRMVAGSQITSTGSLSFLNPSGTAAAFEMTGGAYSASGSVLMGQNTSSQGTSTFTQSGGTFTITSNGGNDFGLANWGGTSQLTVSGGTFSSAAYWGMSIGQRGTGVLTVSGTGSFTQTNASNGISLGGQASGNGTANLDGGTLTTLRLSKGSGSGTVNFNGGTLRPTTTSTNFLQGLTRANVRNGGAVIDTNGINITIGQDLLHSNLGGDNATDGGLTKNGSGTLTLTGANAYTGTTTIQAGTLQIGNGGTTGTLGTHTGAISNSGTLAINRSDDLSLANVVQGTGGLSKAGAGKLTLSAASTYTGATAINGGSLEVATGAAINSTGGMVTANGATLLISGGSVTGTRSDGSTYAFLANSSAATLNMTSGSLTLNKTTQWWDVVVGNYAVATWNQSGGTTTINAGEFDVANNSGSSGTAVNISGGVFDMAGANSTAIVNLAIRGSASFTVGGTAQVTIPTFNIGHASVVGATTGTLNLDGGSLTTKAILFARNTGIVNLNGGTLKAGASSADFIPVANSATNTTNVKAGGARIDTNTFDITIARPLLHDAVLGATADGGLTKSGAGTLTLTGANTYTGTTTVNNGTLVLGASGSITSSTQIVVGASTTLDVAAVGGWTVGTSQTLSGSGTVAGNTTILGDLQPGSSPGTLTFTGNLGLESGSDWLVELGGTDIADFDRLLVGGQLSSSGNILVSLVNSFNPALNDSFQIASFGSFAGSGGTFNFASAPLDPGLSWDTSSFATNGIITVIPEPASALLAAFGAISLSLRRRRQ